VRALLEYKGPYEAVLELPVMNLPKCFTPLKDYSTNFEIKCKGTRGLSHCGLAIYIKKYLKAV
jgi:hypothetical protein